MLDFGFALTLHEYYFLTVNALISYLTSDSFILGLIRVSYIKKRRHKTNKRKGYG